MRCNHTLITQNTSFNPLKADDTRPLSCFWWARRVAGPTASEVRLQKRSRWKTQKPLKQEKKTTSWIRKQARTGTLFCSHFQLEKEMNEYKSEALLFNLISFHYWMIIWWCCHYSGFLPEWQLWAKVCLVRVECVRYFSLVPGDTRPILATNNSSAGSGPHS